jgi:dTDP-4-dehydrorhamnose 3,5-epimerase
MGEAIIKGDNIEGVIIQDLRKIKDDRGSVMHMLRSDSPLFEKFGEIYFSTVKKNVVKAWKRHKIMKQHFTVPVGSIKLVIYDNREKSTTYDQIMEISVGEDNFALVKIPPMVWYGFKGESNDYSLIVNCTTIPFDENEVERITEKSSLIPFNW